MTFSLTIDYNSRTFTFHVERIPPPKELAKSHEWFKLTGGDRVVVLQNNRPMLLAKGLKKVPISWKVVEGSVTYPKALEKVTALIEKHLKGEPTETPTAQPRPSIPARIAFKQSSTGKEWKQGPKPNWGGQFGNKEAQ